MAGIGFTNAKHYKVYPGSFIGRQIGYYEIYHADTNSGTYGNPDYDYTNVRLAMQAIQTHAELLFMGMPEVSNNYGRWIVALAQDTANDGNDTVGNIVNNVLAETILATLQKIPELMSSGSLPGGLAPEDVQFQRVHLYGNEFVTTSDFLEYVITNNHGANLLANPETYAPGSVEQNELVILQSM